MSFFVLLMSFDSSDHMVNSRRLFTDSSLTAAGEYMEDIMLYFNMQEYDKENICLRAYDSRKTSAVKPMGDEVTTQIKREDNNGKLFGDNGAYWRIPFFNNNPRNNNHVCTTILLPWKRFCSINSTATLIVDPKNYSKSTRKISILFKSEATKYNVKHIKICEFDRKSRKPALKGMQCDLYNKNNIKTEEELLAKIDIEIDEAKENSVFVIKVKY